jgi:hypothetical protein
MEKSTYDIVLRETYILLIYSHRTMKKTIKTVAILSAVLAIGTAMSVLTSTQTASAQSVSVGSASSSAPRTGAAVAADSDSAAGASTAGSGTGRCIADAFFDFALCD